MENSTDATRRGNYSAGMANLWEFIKAVFRHWRAGTTGGILAVILLVSGAFHPLSKEVIAGALIGYVVFAAYYAWKEERGKRGEKKCYPRFTES